MATREFNHKEILKAASIFVQINGEKSPELMTIVSYSKLAKSFLLLMKMPYNPDMASNFDISEKEFRKFQHKGISYLSKFTVNFAEIISDSTNIPVSDISLLIQATIEAMLDDDFSNSFTAEIDKMQEFKGNTN
jgi:hypothetical protein